MREWSTRLAPGDDDMQSSPNPRNFIRIGRRRPLRALCESGSIWDAGTSLCEQISLSLGFARPPSLRRHTCRIEPKLSLSLEYIYETPMREFEERAMAVCPMRDHVAGAGLDGSGRPPNASEFRIHVSHSVRSTDTHPTRGFIAVAGHVRVMTAYPPAQADQQILPPSRHLTFA